MTQSNCVDLDKFLEEFVQLEQKVTEISGQNSLSEILLEDANRNMKYLESKEKSVCEVENENLRRDLAAVKEDGERTLEVAQAELQRLLGKLGAEEERHQRALEAVRQQCRREVEESRMEGISHMEAKDAEVTKLLQKKDADLEEMMKKMKDQEKERQSEILKLQIEFGAKLAQVQWNQQPQQQQHQGSQLIPQSVFRRRIRELEENPFTSSSSRLKRRRLSFLPASDSFTVGQRGQK
ncbi:coiled-coil domain-containing protein 152 [Salarias fasciatus]|uniref:coiled-coil domain-containing protein 152 n=1 Tax=Salarias fasciatus TaxID=181472 RepID=UPI001176E3E2|nr:coiled-coil domain-containing protein 152 [Salarias fasciatus]